jgi:hypothetical protein
MRVTSVLAGLFVLAASAVGQWIDRSFWFPDSMYGIEGSNKMLIESGTGRLWFGGFDALKVQVYDPTTGTKVATVPGELACVLGFAQSVPSHRVYVTGDGLTIIDDRDYSVVAQIHVSGNGSLAYDSRDDKMYTDMYYPDSLLLVYKPGPDTLVASLDIGGYIRTLVYDSIQNRLFALRESADIAVIDCSHDTIISHLPVSGEPVWDIALNPVTRRLYSIGWRSPAGNDIRVYDADSLTVLDTISLPAQWDIDDLKLALNPATNRLYGWYGNLLKGGQAYDSVAVLDCNSGVTSFIELPDGYYLANVTPGGSKAYATSAYGDSVAVLGDDSVLGWITFTGGGPAVAGYDPGRNEVYISDYDEQLSVVDVGSDSIVRVVDYSHPTPTWFRWNPSGKMYAGSYGELAAFGDDGKAVFRHKGRYRFGELPAWSSRLNRLYFANRFSTLDPTLWVWDCAGDSIVRTLTLPVPVESLWAVPDHDLVYLPTASQVLIYNTYSDTLVGSIPVAATNFAYNPRNGLVYAYSPNKSDVAVIDPRPGNIVATLAVSPALDVAVNTRDNEVYVNRGGTFCVFDGVSHEKVATVTLPGGGWTFCYVDDWNQLLAFRGPVGWAFDCPARVKSRNFTMPLGTWSEFIWNGRNNKLYAHGGSQDSTLAVVRLPFDTVVASLPAPYFRAMGWNPVTNETYFSDYLRINVVRDEMTGVEDARSGVERPALRVEQNPAAGSVRFVCAAPGLARLAVYDMTGRLAWSQTLAPKVVSVAWNRLDAQGRYLPSGVYVARLESASGRATIKVVLR